MDGLEVLRRIKESRPEVEVIMLTHGSGESAVAAMKARAFDYLSKPLDREELRLVGGKALQAARQAQELAQGRFAALAELSCPRSAESGSGGKCHQGRRRPARDRSLKGNCA
jgi:DNA-binding NtrC family response regulator